MANILPVHPDRNKMSAVFKLFFFVCLSFNLTAQRTSYNFRHITTSDGLSNGVIRGITQDKYGYIWVSTVSGLCRYNGYSIKVFLHSDNDPFSVPDNFAVGLFCDQNKNLWVSFQSGLYNYDYSTGRFNLVETTSNLLVKKMIEVADDAIYCITSKGLGLFHPSDRSFIFPADTTDHTTKILTRKYLSDAFFTKEKLLCLATDTGLVIYNPGTKKANYIFLKPITGQGIEHVAVDNNNNTWVSFGSNGEKVLKVSADLSRYTLHPKFLFFDTKISNSHISEFFIDDHNRLWISTTGSGLCLYDSVSDTFTNFVNSPLKPGSISSYNITNIFQDKQGFIWLGTEGYGINYFHPDDNLFRSILPEYNTSNTITDNWSRAVVEDNVGNLWLGSVNGVACLRKNATSLIIQNQNNHSKRLYSNSVRSLLFDDHGYLWIGTSQGLNRYYPASGHMDFFGEKDSLPSSFFWTIMQDHAKNIWMGCREGLYRYSYVTQTFEHFEKDSLLSKINNYNILSIFEDSRHRLWLGCYNKGTVMYNPGTRTLKHWIKKDAQSAYVNNNIRSFAEDNKSNIWIAGNDGISVYDYRSGDVAKVKPAGPVILNTAELLVDKKDRLWIGTGKGLYVLDSARKYLKSFSLKDGLPSLEMNEQSAFKTSSGDFIYPTLKGFLIFNPDNYKERSSTFNVYISSVKVFNKDYATNTNAEEVKNLDLDYNENFFTLELTALNYGHPEQTSYAYKLEPFDKDWIYTNERLANYTNVPGGDYVFHYKATANSDNWDVPEKNVHIHIGTVYYKTWWFASLMLVIAISLLYILYRYRLKQKENIYSLKNKAQELEKEKAIVQYQSLKEQLNPHFLFNSLTSLRSLIRIDKQSAADFLDKMSMNYRYILRSSESELVSLKDELTFAQGYADLQQSRFGKGLQVNINVSEEQGYKKIVPVTIQNLIENCVKHNSIDEDNPLVIDIYEEGNYLWVRNNLQLKDFVETSNKLGLKHMQSLYRYLDSRPMIIENDAQYFTVKIPLI